MAAVLALTAVGLSLVFGVMRVVNVAHGEFFMLGAVLAWAVANLVGRPGPRLPRRADRRAPRRRADRRRPRPARAAPPRLRARGGDRRHHRLRLHPAAGRALALRPRRPRRRRPLRPAASSSPGSATPATSSRSSPSPSSSSPRSGSCSPAPASASSCARPSGTARPPPPSASTSTASTPWSSASAPALAAIAAVLIVPIQQAHYLMGGDPLLLSFIVVIIGGLGSLARHRRRRAPHRPLRRHHLGLLLAHAGQDPRHPPRRPRPRLPPPGPLRTAHRVMTRLRPLKGTGAPAWGRRECACPRAGRRRPCFRTGRDRGTRAPSSRPLA